MKYAIFQAYYYPCFKKNIAEKPEPAFVQGKILISFIAWFN